MLLGQIAAAFFLVAQAGASVPQAKSEFPQVYEEITVGIKQNYYARDQRRKFVDDALSKHRTKAAAAKTREEFSGVVNEMINEFGDSHFDFFPSTEQGYYLMENLVEDPGRMPHIGMWFGDEERICSFTGRKILMVMNGADGLKFGVRKGDYIVGMADGSRFEPIESLRGKDKVEVRVARPGPQPLLSTKTLTLSVRTQSVAEMFLEAMEKSERIITSGKYKVGYVRLWALMKPEFREEFGRALKSEFKDTDALIVDLRDGFGGSPSYIAEMLGATVEDRYWGRKTKKLYSRHVVVLTNGGTRSAKEMVAYYLKEGKRAFVIGQRTAGHVLGARPIRVSDWAMLEVPASDVTAGPDRLEKIGVAPHLEIADGILDGKDLILDRALQHLREYLEKERAA
jgi:carboxyl-terminal processing protease